MEFNKIERVLFSDIYVDSDGILVPASLGILSTKKIVLTRLD